MRNSIVIVNWNTLDLLRDCLSSIYENLGSLDTEVIVVDNASKDGSQAMVKAEFPDTILIENRENKGFAAANNQALKIARGNYCLLLNSDTVILRDVLVQSVMYLDRNPEVGVMGCRVLNTDRSLQPTCSMFPTVLNILLLLSGLWKLPWPAFLDRYQMRRWDRRDERDVDVVSGCYLMVRRSAMLQIGLLDENFFFFGEETDWCTRFRAAGWKVRFAPVGEIIHHGSVSARKLNHRRDLLLSNGLVRLHRKHNGVVTAGFVWWILLLFNISRACYWAVYALIRGHSHALERRNHFINVVKNFTEVWSTVKVH